MSYFISKNVNLSFDNAIEKVTAELKNEGFGILTEIDVKTTLKKKLDVDFRNYKILGACNPPFAHQALLEEEHIGIMLPCNVVVQESLSGTIIVSVVDPIVAMGTVQNEKLAPLATNIKQKLEKVLENL